MSADTVYLNLELSIGKANVLSYIKMLNIRRWIFELGALCASMIALSMLFVLLVAFNGKPILDWNGISLNTIIATLTVIMKSVMIFSISECVGQWKWILFSQKHRRLMEFERIDLASRGPFGSLLLSWRRSTPYVYSSKGSS